MNSTPEHTNHGPRLSGAFDAFQAFPALSESRQRLLSTIADPRGATAEVVSILQSDFALLIGVLRAANDSKRGPARVDRTRSAVELLGAEAIGAHANRVRVYDFFERPGMWGAAAERLRLHALATRRAADEIARAVNYGNRERLAVTSFLHDIGKLVLIYAYPGYPEQIHQGAGTPQKRIHAERRELGIDHASVGGLLIRRLGLPESLAKPIEQHHNPEAEGEAALIRLADMLAHYEQGAPVSPGEMLQSARAVGLGPEDLRRLMYELPSAAGERERPVEQCPLSSQELLVLRGLAKGAVYKEIARDLALSVSTVRSHLHNTYRKLGVIDRAQAVIFATERGWL